MSTKSHILDIQGDSEVYFDCTHHWDEDGIEVSEITFALSKKDIRIDANDSEDLIFSFDKSSPLFRELYRLFSEEMARPKQFRIGTKIKKTSGEYPFEGELRATFTTKSGKPRMVAELESKCGNGNGILHIFSPTNLEHQ